MTHTLRILSKRGDDAVTWTDEAEAATREAERIFRETRAKGATAFAVAPDGVTRRLDAFDATAEHIVLVPRLIGG